MNHPSLPNSHRQPDQCPSSGVDPDPLNLDRSRFRRDQFAWNAIRFWSHAIGAAVALGFVSVEASAQAAATGTIEGRVMSKATDSYLPNVRVAIDGGNREVFTEENGSYRLTAIAAGELRVRALYVGLEPKVESVRVVAGKVVRLDFQLARHDTGQTESDGKPITLAAVTVVEDREMSAQSIALNEQRAAPNIKNVVAFDEYPNGADRNVAEFLKYIPGVAITYSGIGGTDASIRGIPGNTTPLTIDGTGLASSSLGPGRNAALFAVPTNNISRIEVTKVPTPDMPASGLGGSINIISKSGFERKRPLLTYNIYSSFPYRSDDALTLKERVGPTGKLTSRTTLPSFDLNYLRPVNESLVVTLTASQNLNYNEARTTSPTWDLVNLVQTATSFQISPSIVEVRSGRIGVDWKVAAGSVLSASMQYRKREGTSAQHNFNTAMGAGATGGPTFAQGAATGVGSLTMSVGPSLELHNGLMLSTLKFSHKGNIWNVNANGGYSVSKHRRPSTEKGYFSTVTSTISNVVIRADGISGSGNNKASIQPASYRIVDRTGATVNPFNGNDYSLATTLENAPAARDEKMEARLDLSRNFGLSVPFTLKTGLAVARQEVASSDTSKTYTFRSGASVDVRKAGNYGLVDEAYSAAAPAYMTGDKFQWISGRKIYDLFKTRPNYFLLNEAAAYSTRVNGSKKFNETISATYIRGDIKFLETRLWLVAGVRYERTENEGQGPLDDISAQYVRDAAGKLVRDAAGQPTLISNDALLRNQLRYKEYGTRGGGTYGNFYPSVNATYTIIDGLVARAGYARTIGRPNVSLIIPGVTISEPTATNPTITVVDSGLKPWTADNYDLTLETYLLKGGFGSVGIFKKDIKGFFVSTAREATPDLLENYGIPTSADYLNYTVQTKANGGDASINGLEFAYKQSLAFLPRWARGAQVFVNYTKLSLGGSSQSDFTGFNPKTLSWGASFIRGRFAVKFTSSEQGETRRAPVATSATIPNGTYLWQGAKTRYTLGFDYAFTRNVGFHVALNNFNGLGFTDIQRRYATGTPEYAKFQRFQEWGKNAVVGIKGEF